MLLTDIEPIAGQQPRREDVTQPKKGPIRVLLADDHALVRAGFVSLLKDLGAEVIGEADKVADIIPKYRSLRPQVVMLDIRFGETQTGIDAAEALLKEFPDANVVFLSQFDQNTLITRTYQLGGKAYLTKDCDSSDVVAALNNAAEGKTYYMPRVAQLIAELHVHGDRSPQALLSARDLEIFKRIARGMTLDEISKELGIHAKTVGNASLAMKTAFNIERQADFTFLAIRSGLIQP